MALAESEQQTIKFLNNPQKNSIRLDLSAVFKVLKISQ
jgi:hypothetical protein